MSAETTTTAAAAGPALETEALTVSYGRTRVFEDLTLAVPREVAHRGQDVPRPQPPGGDEVPDGFLDLAPDGDGERRVDADSWSGAHARHLL